jgi:hypothetical protein
MGRHIPLDHGSFSALANVCSHKFPSYELTRFNQFLTALLVEEKFRVIPYLKFCASNKQAFCFTICWIFCCSRGCHDNFKAMQLSTIILRVRFRLSKGFLNEAFRTETNPNNASSNTVERQLQIQLCLS